VTTGFQSVLEGFIEASCVSQLELAAAVWALEGFVGLVVQPANAGVVPVSSTTETTVAVVAAQ